MIKVAAIQMEHSESVSKNRVNAEQMVRDAASQGAQIILLSELFESTYFCKVQEGEPFNLAFPWDKHPLKKQFESLAKELNVVLPISFFEKSGNAYFNSIAIIDINGETLGVYRKSHIPQGPGYEEKFYFSPGDSGFKVWETAYGKIGVGICWDQWFPEAARSMALLGADILLYPTAIGSEPENSELDSSEHWMSVQRGHAGANMIPVVAANRIGVEKQGHIEMTFYGSSFITGHRADIRAKASRDTQEIIMTTFDFEKNSLDRAQWGLFRDRRPDLYNRLGTL